MGWSGTNFAEAAANDGGIATTSTLTLYGDTFADTTYTNGTHFSASGVPAGLSAALVNVKDEEIMKTVYLIKSFRDEIIFSPADIA